jgi:methyl-accepting chemotaxis protein
MFQNMKLGTKISFGFGVVLCLALILGGLGVVNMFAVKGDSMTLANEYVPEVEYCNMVERNAMLTMYGIRGYSLSEDYKFYEEGMEYFAEVKKWLGDCEQLAAEAEHLTKLAPAVEATKKAMDQYEDLVAQTVALDENMDGNRKNLDAAAAKYMQNCTDFLDGQNEKMKNEIVADLGVEALNERLLKITTVNDIIDVGNATRIACFKSQALRDPQLIRDANKNFEVMDEKFALLRQICISADDQRRIDNTQGAANEYKAAMNGLLENWVAMQEISKQRGAAGDAMLAEAQNTAEAGIEGTRRIAQSASSRLSASSNTLLVGLAVCTVLGVLIAVFITRSITGPLRRIIEGLTAGSQQTASAAGQVSSASVSLADGASRQAAAIEETSSSVEEMAAMTRQNASNAGKANALAGTAKTAADKGVDSMERMNTAIDDIKQSSDSTARIIKTIDEIAFQTNLLALNAAVEAARAGEAGKGFAVVAEEVRNLAQRSAEAAKNTAEMIEESVRNADNGVAITKEVAEALAEISGAASEVNALVAGIATASNEQSEGIEQINQAVGQLDHITQANAANAEESASASEELSGQAEELNGMVRELMAMVGGTNASLSAAPPVHRSAPAPAPMAKAPKAPARSGSHDQVVSLDDADLDSLLGSPEEIEL